MFVLPVALALIPSVPTETVLEDYTGLIPSGATVLVRIESLDAAHAALVRMEGIFEGQGEIPAKEDLLSQMFSLPIDGTHIDPTRPIYMAAEVTLGPPLPTFLLPARDVAGLSAAVAETGATAVVRGDWVGFSMGPRYQPVATNPRVAEMQPGVLSVNVDLEQLLEVFGGFIEMGLTQVESSMAEMLPPEETGGMDMEIMMELYLDGLRTFLDCAESLDLAVYEDGEELAFTGIYTALEDSDLADLMKPRPLPETLPAPLDPGAPIVVLMSADWKEFTTCFGPVMESFMDVYPDEMSAGFGAYMTALSEAYAQMGDTAVGTGGFGPGGMSFAFHAEAPDPAALAQKFADAINESAAQFAQMGMVYGPQQTIEVGEVSAQQWALEIDYEQLSKVVGTGPVDDQARDLVTGLYGPNPRFSLAHAEGRVCLSFGSDEAELAKALAGLGGKRVPAAPVLAGLRGLPASINPLIMYRVDLAQIMAFMGPLMALPEDAPDLSATPMKMTVWMGLDGRRWLGGLSTRTAELKGFAQALKDD